MPYLFAALWDAAMSHPLLSCIYKVVYLARKLYYYTAILINLNFYSANIRLNYLLIKTDARGFVGEGGFGGERMRGFVLTGEGDSSLKV